MVIKWNAKQRDTFARMWPCCDVPAEGFAEFDAAGDLIDISDNTRDCERGGGVAEFIQDLQEGKDHD